MISLAEELLLLAIDDTTGKISPPQPQALEYGLAGAILLDLLIAGRLDLADGALALTDTTPLGDAVLDRAAAKIGQTGAVGDTGYWVEQLGRDQLQEQVLADLVQRRILRKEEHRLMWVIPDDRYPTADPVPEREVRARLRAVVLDGKPPRPRTAALIGLMKVCNLTSMVFSKDEQQDYGWRIDEIARADAIGQAVSRAAEAAQAAIAAATAAAIAASIAGSVAASTAACSTAATSACTT